MEDDVVVVAALGEGGEVGAGLEKSKSVFRCKRTEDWIFKVAWSSHTLGAWLL